VHLADGGEGTARTRPSGLRRRRTPPASAGPLSGELSRLVPFPPPLLGLPAALRVGDPGLTHLAELALGNVLPVPLSFGLVLSVAFPEPDFSVCFTKFTSSCVRGNDLGAVWMPPELAPANSRVRQKKLAKGSGARVSPEYWREMSSTRKPNERGRANVSASSQTDNKPTEN
jgi:hypothetical protein